MKVNRNTWSEYGTLINSFPEYGMLYFHYLFNFSPEYPIGKVQKIRKVWNCMEYLLICAECIITFGENINTIRKSTEALLEASRWWIQN
jgi:hypothetical protein